jgi:hypothetical protein
MDEAAIARRPQIHSRVISKWREVLSADQVAGFEEAYGELISGLGYELERARLSVPDVIDASGWFTDGGVQLDTEVDAIELTWPEQGQFTEGTPHRPLEDGVDVRLLVDGVSIRPTVCFEGAYSFAVPSGAKRVRLKSSHVVAVDPEAPHPGASRSVRVKVREVVIRSRVGEFVIPADDPRLVSGWHDAERPGAGLWRWADGSADLPWGGVEGPAVLTVRTLGFSEHAVAQGVMASSG